MGSTVKEVDIAFVSAFSRAVFLAQKTVQLKKKIAFLDLTPAFPPPSAEDLEGPFGVFQSDRLSEEDGFRLSPSGFAVRADHSSFYFKEIFLRSVYEKYPEYQTLKKWLQGEKLGGFSFSSRWLIHLLSSYGSFVDESFNVKSLKGGLSFNVFDDFGACPYPGPAKDHLSSFENVFFQELNSNDKLSLQSGKRGKPFVLSWGGGELLLARSLVFMLGPEETFKLNPSLFHLFFSKKKLKPSFSWSRFSFFCDEKNYPLISPLILADPQKLPWDQGRFLSLKKSFIHKKTLNVWAKIPFGGSPALLAPKIKKCLKEAFPPFEQRFLEGPATPSFLYPVYSEGDFKKMKAPPLFCYRAEGLSPSFASSGIFKKIKEQN